MQLPKDTYIEYIPPTKRKTDRRGERGYLAYLEKSCQNKTLVVGDFLLSDNETSFKTDLATDFEKSKGILRDYFVPQLGHLMDPCDNEFHAATHIRYWKIIDAYKRPTLLQQIQAIHESYFAIPESSIRSYFVRCGIIGETPPHLVLEKLFFEGVYPAKKFRNLHKKQLQNYIDWHWNKKKTILDIFGTGYFETLFDQKL